MVGLIKLENVAELKENWPLSGDLLKSSLITSSIQYFPQGLRYLINMKVDMQHLWIYRMSYATVTICIYAYFMSCLSSFRHMIHPTKFLSQKYKKKQIRESMQVQVPCHRRHMPSERTKVHTLAWWRSTPYIDSFLAFSRKCISASAGVIPLWKSNHVTKCVGNRSQKKMKQLENIFSLSELQPYPLGCWVPTRAKALVQTLLAHMLLHSSLSKDTQWKNNCQENTEYTTAESNIWRTKMVPEAG